MFGGGGFDGSIPNVAGNVPAGPADQPLPLGRGYATFASDSRPPGRRARLAGRQLPPQRRGAAQLRRRRAQEDARRRGLPDQGALRRRRDPEGVLRRRLDRRPRGDRRDHALARRLGRRDRLVPGVERSRRRSSAAIASTARWPSRAPTRASPSGSCCCTAALQACDGLDGVVDGLISNQLRCNAVFDPATATRQRQRRCAAPTAPTPATPACRTRRSPRSRR